MTPIKLILVLAFLTTGTVMMREGPKVTSLMSKDLTEFPGKKE
jgi:hypothetical protein